MSTPQTGEGQNDLLIATLKHTNGTIDFQAVAQEMSLTTSGAAQKRVKRLLEKIAPGENLLVGSTLGSGAPGSPSKSNTKSNSDDDKVPQTPKTPATPKSRSKRKAKDIEDDDASDEVKENNVTDATPSKDSDVNDAEIEEEEPKSSTKKKAKTTKPRAPRAAKAPGSAKAKATKSPKSPKNAKAKAETVVVDENENGDEQDVTEDTIESATASMEVMPTEKANEISSEVKEEVAEPAATGNTAEPVKEESASAPAEIDILIPGETLMHSENAQTTEEAKAIDVAAA